LNSEIFTDNKRFIMSKSIKITTGILLLAFLAINSSCKKYDDGPWFSIYSKNERVTGKWFFQRVTEDGVNVTKDYDNQSVELTKSGHLIWVQGYNESYWDTYGPVGTWSFTDNKNRIEMYFFYGVPEEFTYIWDITRMAYGDLRLSRYENGKKIEWRLWKF
jgi:hypothetical protein